MKVIEVIAKIPLFSGLPKEQLAKVAGIVTEQALDKGEAIFSQGDEASGFYVVTSGMVKIFKLSSEGKEQILHFVGPGQTFGEVPMFSGERFPANAEAIEKSRVLFLPRTLFLELIKQDPFFAMRMLSELSKRLRHFNRLVEELSLKEVPGRLAAYILYLSGSKGGAEEITLSITKGHLASLLGTIPETISRILGKMSSQDIIRVQGRKIKILNRRTLEEISESGKYFL